MDRESLATVSALAKSCALVNYKGSLSIDVTRYTTAEGQEVTWARVLLHGRGPRSDTCAHRASR